jgi:3-isopropylmalate/(R)-2-methylmalate dehydratase large subunit
MSAPGGQTITEKILSRASGGEPVRAGEDIEARPDFVLAYVFGGFVKFPRLIREEFGVQRLDDPSRFALFLDHNIPVTDARLEARLAEVRAWCADQGVAVHDGEGIGHVAAGELGYASPGAFVVHFDGHVSQLGTYGALAMGIHIGLYEAFARPAIHLRVPPTVRVDLTGALPRGVMARDVLHALIARHGADFCNGAVLELGGPGAEALTLEDLQTITGLAMFTGAVTAIVEPGPRSLAYAAPRARTPLDPVRSDPDALYLRRLGFDLCAARPSVAAPPSSANIRSLDELLGLPVDVGYLGSCASGRIEDLRVAAQVLEARRVKRGFTLNVVPSTRRVMMQAAEEGLIARLAAAGAFISSPTCSYCYGAVGALAAGQTAVSSGTLNIPGRMGSAEAAIYLASPAVVAATAIEGRLADPGLYL